MRDFIVPLTRSQGRAARPYGIPPGKRHGPATAGRRIIHSPYNRLLVTLRRG